MRLHLPKTLEDSIWEHAKLEFPRECVGAMGGNIKGSDIYALASYPLSNVAAHPESEYLADNLDFVKALRSMQLQGIGLISLYHSHPKGPSKPSISDIKLASYPFPYIIADVSKNHLEAFILPESKLVEIVLYG